MPLFASAACALALGCAALATARGQQPVQASGKAFAAQVEAGRTAYATHCAACHGADMAGGQFASSLTGAAFLAKWGGAPAQDLYTYIRNSMPPGGAGTLPDETYAALAALILSQNGGHAERALAPGDAASLAAATLPKPSLAADAVDEVGIGGISTRYPMPHRPEPADRFASFTPVTEAMLDDPAPENWMSWRRGHNGQGYSPLGQINTGNVGQLRLAWAQPLPTGETTNEPLVRDGVLYIYGYGDQVFAFDAATGRMLWRYQRTVPEGTVLSSKKTLALYGDKLFAATSDLHLAALDARTGRPVWDVPITGRPGFRNPGGPLAADGVIMQGLTTQEPGGGLIAAFDAETGKHLWTFDTVAKPGTPGGDSWNGLPADQRRGGSVWTSGTYDAASGLALWGVAQTYDTGPVRDRKPGLNNDGLFTNSTLAFEPRSGKLVWYFQHVKNDQYDLDWVFDRVIGTVEKDGHQRRVVITGGKEGLFDMLEVETGKYVDTVDMGLQNFITAIDPVTGDKTVDPALVPGRDKGSVFVCPHSGGGRNWSPTSFNPHTHSLFVNARDVCMEMVPSEKGFLTSGVNILYSPPKDGDGNYGVLQSLDMDTGEKRWEVRRRAPFDMGILTTAGGLLFTGGVDRQVLAYDQADGREVWRSALPGVPNGSPITYSVDGRQYVAMVTGEGNPLSFGLPEAFTPELPQPAVNNAALYVFALPEGE
ncbi:conserved hypothetical protein [Altererythrobacter sp. B11]|uniref:outer membrane protein assembly factor BamB family protein n=1 Tax=Altererythrobacter sp. B11 TaxID=2060312 RepID=UPI000DC72CD6|nr:PQQ-binding-like beta-propeller repeat protein [Altererythrobacter sp. B11]BBC73898.1 conserved hypothetical protein [Altererythrobacter sp. B11]